MVNNVQKASLLIDMGNSAIKWARSDSSGLSAMSYARYPENMSATFFTDCLQKLDAPSDIIVSCVVADNVWQALVKACDELWGVELQKVTALKEGFGVVNAYEDAASLGSDRWCAMLGGQANTDSAFMVIDAGSALTLDIVNESKRHLGGYIVPGLKMMKQSLGLQTAQVQVESSAAKLRSLALGQSTTGCVEAGTLLSLIALIEAAFGNEAKQLGKCQVYITGGDAELIAGFLSFKCVIIPDLVLRGLAVIAANSLENN